MIAWKGWECISVAEFILSIQEILSSIPSRKGERGRGKEKEEGGKLSILAYAFNPSTQKAKAARL